MISKRRRRWLWGGGAAVLVLLGIGAGAVAVSTGTIWPGRIFASGYAVRGVDVSTYQGDIDWPVLADQGIDFAYIKATEGSSFVDDRFADNWSAAEQTDLLVGAYHFLSFESTGEAQAQHVIDTVPQGGDLPIAIDVEFYGSFFEDPPARAEVDAILIPLIAALKEHYGTDPVIYATPEAYDRYISGSYADNPIWIRSVVFPPALGDGRDWTIWQYSPREQLKGYDGDEQYIDMNVTAGTRADLEKLGAR